MFWTLSLLYICIIYINIYIKYIDLVNCNKTVKDIILYILGGSIVFSPEYFILHIAIFDLLRMAQF